MSGKVAIVTGGATGLGKYIVECLAVEGVTVISFDISHSHSALEPQGQDSDGLNSFELYVDVANADAVEAAVAQVIDRFKRIDILINNAGIGMHEQFVETQPELWDSIYAVNMKGVFNCCKFVLPSMMENNGGKIINVSSILSVQGIAYASIYAASKAAINGFTKSLAKEVGLHNIAVNAVCPALMETEMMFAHMKTAEITRLKQLTRLFSPIGKPASLQFVTSYIRMLAVEMHREYTGQIIYLDGGMY